MPTYPQSGLLAQYFPRISDTGQLLGSDGIPVFQGARPLPTYALARAATLANTADTYVAFVGDSKTAGAYASGSAWAGCRPLSITARVTTLLAPYLPVSDDSSFGLGDTSGTALVSAGYDTRITAVGANWTNTTFGWLGGGAVRNDTNAVSEVRYAFPRTSNTVDLYTLQSTGGASLAVSINGGASVQTVSTNASLAIQKTSVSVTAGVNTFGFTRQAGTGACPIVGVLARNTAARRVHIMNFGSSGITAGQYADPALTYGLFAGIAIMAPHLTFIDLGTNDVLTGVTPATTVAAVQSIIDQCQLSGDVVGVIPAPVASGSASLAAQKATYFALRELYQKNGCNIIDKWALYGSHANGVASGYYQTANDPVHPGQAGYLAEARLTASLLLTA